MKAATAQIYVGGQLILHAKGLKYDKKNMQLTGLVLEGSVEQVRAVLEGLSEVGLLPPGPKKLEIRLSLF